MTVLAHVGHWYHSLLYAAPIVLIALALWWSGRRDSGSRAAKERDDDGRAGDEDGGGEPARDQPGRG
jgi:hypothetical protein